MKRYEQSIRVITTFFAALLGLGLKNLLDPEAFNPANARWPCFLMSVFLFLRFLLGSNNHLWFEFVRPDLDRSKGLNEPPYVPPSRGRVINDFIFLVVLGLLGVAICYSTSLDEFLDGNLLLTGVGLAWVVGYWIVGRMKEKSIQEGDWNYWGPLNLVQFASVLVIHCLVPSTGLGTVPGCVARVLPGPAWDWSLLILFIVYLGVFVWDFVMQLRIVEGAK